MWMGDTLKDLRKFLSSSKGRMGSSGGLEGHISTPHKDVIRVVSGSYLEDSIKALASNKAVPLPSKAMARLAEALDRAQIDITQALAQRLLGCTNLAAVGRKYSIPLFTDDSEQGNDDGKMKKKKKKKKKKEKKKKQATTSDDNNNNKNQKNSSPKIRQSPKTKSANNKPYGLVDVAWYRMDPGTPPLVVAAHIDPGLFVLALPQSSSGLQLLTREKKWVSPPVGRGVLWAGEAASIAGIPGATHRVETSKVGASRLACWHETCTAAQLTPPMLARAKASGLELKLGQLVGTQRVLELLRRAENHQSSSLTSSSGNSSGVAGDLMEHERVLRTQFNGDLIQQERVAMQLLDSNNNNNNNNDDADSDNSISANHAAATFSDLVSNERGLSPLPLEKIRCASSDLVYRERLARPLRRVIRNPSSLNASSSSTTSKRMGGLLSYFMEKKKNSALTLAKPLAPPLPPPGLPMSKSRPPSTVHPQPHLDARSKIAARSNGRPLRGISTSKKKKLKGGGGKLSRGPLKGLPMSKSRRVRTIARDLLASSPPPPPTFSNGQGKTLQEVLTEAKLGKYEANFQAANIGMAHLVRAARSGTTEGLPPLWEAIMKKTTMKRGHLLRLKRAVEDTVLG